MVIPVALALVVVVVRGSMVMFRRRRWRAVRVLLWRRLASADSWRRAAKMVRCGIVGVGVVVTARVSGWCRWRMLGSCVVGWIGWNGRWWCENGRSVTVTGNERCA